MVTEIKCDLFEAPVEIICHSCNCFHTFGLGLAKEIKQRFPEAYEADLKTPKGNLSKVGTVSIARINREGVKVKYVINCYTQFKYGKGERHTDYEAMYTCLETIRAKVTNSKLRIGIPYRMGCNLGGADWEIVRQMIFSVFGDTPKQVYICCKE